ncbi:AraC family transcriptional regulator [Mycolicibacterium sp. BiH015]|uniref:AraC family transcriptional regulator n=1 Tax=Mycolicibacterium sp. BiH015 TaxID=3018808 RepID=UPI0022E39A15|nr:AraC family transcriptional regulator [Mycolicibacterium sp. BiH015]
MPGLTIHRFTRPTRPQWDHIESLSVGVIAYGTGGVVALAGRRLGGHTHCAVIGSGKDFDCQIIEASSEHPVLCLVVRVAPQLVASVAATMRVSARSAGRRGEEQLQVCTPDIELMDTIVRFAGALSAGCDRRVLAPLRLQELVYRVLQSGLRSRLLSLAAAEEMANPVAAALDYIAAHLGDPLTVEKLAAQVCLSPSAFTRAFRDATGRSPYQFVKEARLDRARHMLDDGRIGIAHVAHSVGYASVSHFIKGFRARFGVTPGDYAATHIFRQLSPSSSWQRGA